MPGVGDKASPAWRPRLVAFDADGTIVGPDDRIPPALAAALRRIESLGVPLVLVTGRAWLSAKLVLDELGLAHSHCVCNNGATICTYPPFEIIQSITFDARPIIEALAGEEGIALAVEEFGSGYRANAEFPLGELHGRIRIVPAEELAPQPVTRLVVRGDGIDAAAFQAKVRQLDLGALSHFVGWSNWLDVASAAVDKGAGLGVVAERLGIAQADTLALGDGYNDIELLRWAGRGVALADAPDIVQQAADAVTGSFAESGAYTELARWFDLD